MKTNQVVFRDDLYPRFEPNQAAIQKYANSLAFLPPIKVNQNNILIDGFHRWKAHQLEGAEEIAADVLQTASEKELKRLAYQLNSIHGLQLSTDEKQRYAQEMIGEMSVADLAEILSVSESTIKNWTSSQRKAIEEETNRRIIDLYLLCYTQEQIAEMVGVDKGTVSRKIENLLQNANLVEMQQTFTPLLYNIWNLQKQDNAVDSHFGSFPQLFMENLLHYHTDPLDIVFDPFAGGGTTVDACRKMFRRYYCSDRIVKPGREKHIHQHDITTGLPPNMQKPKLAFLDPPYWKQAEGSYSNDQEDLANMTLDQFNNAMKQLIESLCKWQVQNIAIVIQPTQYKNKWKFTDHIFDFATMFSTKYGIAMRYILPYSTQQYNAQMVEKAKTENKCLALNRDLVIWKLKGM